MILLDSSIIIDFLRRKNKQTTSFFKLISLNESCAISIITHTELYSGKSVWEKPRALEELNTIISGLEILTLTIDVSKQAGKLRAKYGINPLDALIAQTAISHKTELATLNIKHFSAIPNLKLVPLIKPHPRII